MPRGIINQFMKKKDNGINVKTLIEIAIYEIYWKLHLSII